MKWNFVIGSLHINAQGLKTCTKRDRRSKKLKKMKNSIVALRLRNRLQEIFIAENINQYCNTFEILKKCTSYTKSRDKPFCCKINEDNYQNFYQIRILQPNENDDEFKSVLDLNFFFTFLFLFPCLILILMHFMSYCKRR